MDVKNVSSNYGNKQNINFGAWISDEAIYHNNVVDLINKAGFQCFNGCITNPFPIDIMPSQKRYLINLIKIKGCMGVVFDRTQTAKINLAIKEAKKSVKGLQSEVHDAWMKSIEESGIVNEMAEWIKAAKTFSPKKIQRAIRRPKSANKAKKVATKIFDRYAA